MKNRILVTVLSAIFLIAGVGSLQAETIKVGAAINLTGPASTWGQFHEKGLRDYFRYVNEVKGGVFGNKIEMITVDTAYKVPEAQAAVNRFVLRDKVDMIATWGAGEGLAAKPIIQKYKVPAINFSTSWEISGKTFGLYVSYLSAVTKWIAMPYSNTLKQFTKGKMLPESVF